MSKDLNGFFSVVAGNVLSLVTTQDTSACIEATSNAIDGLSAAFGSAIDAITLENTASMASGLVTSAIGHSSAQDGGLAGQAVVIQAKAKLGK